MKKKWMAPKRIMLLSNAVLFLLFLSCQNHDLPYTDHDVFRYNEARNITSLDPAFARNPQNNWAAQQLFNGLVQLNDSLEVIPEIAKSWTIDSTGTVYRFHLRKDVFFHASPAFKEGIPRAVTAADFVYSFDRLLDPELASPGGWVLQRVAGYRALDSHTLEIKLKNPFPAFLGLLSMRYCAVVPEEGIAYYGSRFRSNPIGTGPFVFKYWEEGVKLILRKNTTYFEKDDQQQPLPYLEAIAIQFIPDIQSEFMLFLQGKLDFMNSLDNSYKDELLTPDGLLRPKYKDKIIMQQGPYLNTEYIGFYMEADHPIMKNPALREALSIGFDRNQMIDYLRNNIGFTAYKGFIPKGLPGHADQDWVRHDPQAARERIRTFETDNGPLPTLKIATDANYLDLCEYLQREWEKIGVKLQIDVMPTATLRQAKSSGKLELFRASWIADYPDAENYLGLYYSKNFAPFGPNYTHFKNETYDSLFEKTFLIKSPKQRYTLYKKLDSIVMTHHPIINLFYDKAVRFLQPNVVGMTMNPINTLNLKRVKKE
ncbi:MAG: ABC transporter substrate-binding protein [Flavobacteriaceae bacterium]